MVVDQNVPDDWDANPQTHVTNPSINLGSLNLNGGAAPPDLPGSGVGGGKGGIIFASLAAIAGFAMVFGAFLIVRRRRLAAAHTVEPKSTDLQLEADGSVMPDAPPPPEISEESDYAWTPRSSFARKEVEEDFNAEDAKSDAGASVV